MITNNLLSIKSFLIEAIDDYMLLDKTTKINKECLRNISIELTVKDNSKIKIKVLSKEFNTKMNSFIHSTTLAQRNFDKENLENILDTLTEVFGPCTPLLDEKQIFVWDIYNTNTLFKDNKYSKKLNKAFMK